DYCVMETAAPAGYAISDTKYFVDVTETNTELEGDQGYMPKQAVITVYKGTTEDTKPNEKKVFTIDYDITLNNSNEVESKKITITGPGPAESGEFVVTPGENGWEVDRAVGEKFIFDEKEGIVYPAIQFEPKGNVITDEEQIWFEKIDSSTGKLLKGAELSITGTDLTYDYTSGDASEKLYLAIGKHSAEENAIKTGNSLETAPLYTLSEKAAPTGYKNDAEDIFFKVVKSDQGCVLYTGTSEDDLTANDSRVVTMKNTEQGNIALLKYEVGKEDTPLKGATLQLVKLNPSAFSDEKLNSTTAKKLSDLEAADYEIVQIDGADTFQSDEIVYPELEPGVYGFIETAVPTVRYGATTYATHKEDAVGIVNVFSVMSDGTAQAGRHTPEEFAWDQTSSAYYEAGDENSGSSWNANPQQLAFNGTNAFNTVEGEGMLLESLEVTAENTSQVNFNYSPQIDNSMFNITVNGNVTTFTFLGDGITAAQFDGFQVQVSDWNNGRVTGVKYNFKTKEVIQPQIDQAIASAETFSLKPKTRETTGRTIYMMQLGNEANSPGSQTLRFIKQNEDGRTIENTDGMEFKLERRDSSGQYVSVNGVDNWTSNSRPLPFGGVGSVLSAGYTYRITEVSAPSGYSIADPLYVKITQEGYGYPPRYNVYADNNEDPTTQITGTVNEGGFFPTYTYSVIMTDELIENELSFGKVDNSNKMSIIEKTADMADYLETVILDKNNYRVAGAEMELKLVNPDVTGADFSDVTASLGTTEDNTSEEYLSGGKAYITSNTITWKTTNEDNKFTGLPNGTYSLKEIKGVGTYQPIVDCTIIIKDGVITGNPVDSRVTTNPLEISGTNVLASDALYTASVRKTRYTGEINSDGTPAETPVPGAKLRLTRKDDGQTFSFANVIGHDNQIHTGDGSSWNRTQKEPSLIENNKVENIAENPRAAYEWYSTGSAVIFTGLIEGTYYIDEIEAPVGFEPAERKEFTITRSEASQSLSMTSGKDAGANYDQVTIINEKKIISVSKTDMGGNIVEGAKFLLSGDNLDGVYINQTSDQLKEGEVVTGNKSNGDTRIDNDKFVTLNIGDDQDFTIRGNTFNNVLINGEAVNSKVEQNKYFISGTSSGGKIDITGLCDGIYIVTLEDGTEYSIRVDHSNTEDVSYVTKMTKPEKSGDAISFEGGSVDFVGLKDGTYTLVETAAPNGFDVVSQFTFTVTDGKIDKSSISAVTNGDVEVSKNVYEVELDSDTGSIVSITKNGEADSTVTVSKETVDGKTVVKINGNEAELKDGKYVYEEEDDSHLIIKDDTKTITINKTAINGDDEIELDEENRAHFKLTVVSLDDETQTLDTLRFANSGDVYEVELNGDNEVVKLTKNGEDDTTADVTVNVTEGDAEVLINGNKAALKDGKYVYTDLVFSEITADGNVFEFDGNNAKFQGLAPGTYELEETVAPNGATVVSKFTFTIDENYQITVVDQETTGFAEVEKDGSLKIKDDVSKIRITKNFETAEKDAEKALTAKLQLEFVKADASKKIQAGFGPDTLEEGEKSKIWDAADGVAREFIGLMDGEYKLIETEKTDGFELADPITFYIVDGKAYQKLPAEETEDPETAAPVQTTQVGAVSMVNVTTTTTTTTTETTTTETTTTTTETTTTETTTTTTETTTTETTTTTTETTTTETTTTTTETTTTETTTTTTETTVTSTTETTVTTVTTVTTKTIVIDKVAVNGDDEIKLDEENRAHFKLTVV
ncbi:MAG: hypothetical protein IJ170_03035, partial [Ruminococcus sp.]|nr:hypothetical protein [Ruminococcus sp.]